MTSLIGGMFNDDIDLTMMFMVVNSGKFRSRSKSLSNPLPFLPIDKQKRPLSLNRIIGCKNKRICRVNLDIAVSINILTA